MKNDLATAIITAIVGVVASYFLVGLLFGEIEDVSISSVDPNLTVNLTEPNADIFNFRSVNPTVEVYVGECDEYDETTGVCLDESKNEDFPVEENSSDGNETKDGEPENNELEENETDENSEPESETPSDNSGAENEVEEDF